MSNLTAFSCDTCSKPGHCCKGFGLNTSNNDPLGISMELMQNGLTMFELVQTVEPQEGQRIKHLFRCTMLEPDGRCGIYESRPKLCRDYKPGSDPMCVYHIRHLNHYPVEVEA